MTENLPGPAPQALNADRYKVLVVVLTVLTTVITAMVSGLQADANIRASASNNDSQVYAIQTAGELHRQGLQSAYDTSVFAGYLKDSQEATVMQITALDQQQKGDPQGSQASLQRAAEAQARADTARLFSIFFSDSRYAPVSAEGVPDMQAYLTDSYAAANDLLARQNAASDDYNHWNHKGDAYTSVLAILAIAFFLFALAQALTPRLRMLFAIFGLAAMAGAGFWTILILLS
jgi:hypothetical protein